MEITPNCRTCIHCGPDARTHPVSGVTLIRCNHADWEDEETDMRELDPTFGEMCEDYSRQNK